MVLRCSSVCVLGYAALTFNDTCVRITYALTLSQQRLSTVAVDVIPDRLASNTKPVAVLSDVTVSTFPDEMTAPASPDELSQQQLDGSDLDASMDDMDMDGPWKTRRVFRDVTSKALPKEWKEWNHVGHPRNYCGTPVFPDWNNDGFLDFFYHNHYEMNPATDWDMGVSYGVNEGSGPWWNPVAMKTFECTEEKGSEYVEQEMDTHSTVILDIDRDGLKDMYISVGGGKGYEVGADKNSALFWGTTSPDSKRVHLVGGRDVAEKSGLENKDSRGRFSYFLDFNGDGLLDVVYANDVRMDDLNKPGYALMNRGNRNFEPDWDLSEYAFTMILTDADLDGVANEFVVQRRNCLPKILAQPQKIIPNIKNLAQEDIMSTGTTEDRSAFCSKRPEGTVGVYRFNHTRDRIEMISPPVEEEAAKGLEMAWGMQTGDFDGDTKADLVVLRDTSLEFYYSSDRKAGELPTHRRASETITWDAGKCLGRALRIADFDLDGADEILIMCGHYASHRMYKRSVHKNWFLFPGGLGDLSDESLPPPDRSLLKETCARADLVDKRLYVQNLCKSFRGEREMPKIKTYGMAVIDWDNDGYLDVTVTHDFGNLLMFKNEFAEARGLGKKNKFLAVKLHGTVSNEYGIGATLILKARNVGFNNGTTTQFREVNSASHETDWWGSKDDRIIFGLDQHGVPEELTIQWPGQGLTKQVINDARIFDKHINSMSNLLHVIEPRPKVQNLEDTHLHHAARFSGSRENPPPPDSERHSVWTTRDFDLGEPSLEEE